MPIHWWYVPLAYIMILAAPTMFGLCMALTCSVRGAAIKNRALVLFVKELPQCPFVNTGRFRGLTIGHIIFIKESERDNARLLHHELIHVRQEERHLGLLPVLYLWENLRKGYKNNRFEVEARERSKHLN